MLAIARQHHGRPTFWLVLGSVAFAGAALYGALWYRGGANGESYRNRRYKISVYGLIAWGLLCYARAATLS